MRYDKLLLLDWDYCLDTRVFSAVSHHDGTPIVLELIRCEQDSIPASKDWFIRCNGFMFSKGEGPRWLAEALIDKAFEDAGKVIEDDAEKGSHLFNAFYASLGEK